MVGPFEVTKLVPTINYNLYNLIHLYFDISIKFIEYTSTVNTAPNERNYSVTKLKKRELNINKLAGAPQHACDGKWLC